MNFSPFFTSCLKTSFVISTLVICQETMSAPFAYVTDTGGKGTNYFTVLDIGDTNVTETIPLLSLSRKTFDIAIMPGGNTAYVTNFISLSDSNTNRVAIIDLINRYQVGQIVPPPPLDHIGAPLLINLSPNSKWAYLSVSFKPGGYYYQQPYGPIGIFDTTTNQVIGNIVDSQLNFFGPVTFSPDGATAYVFGKSAEGNTYQLVSFDTATNVILSTISDSRLSSASWLAVSPNGKFAYATTDKFILVFNLNKQKLATKIRSPYPCHFIGFTPDGTKAYVSASGNSNVAETSTLGTILVIDPLTNTITKQITGEMSYPRGIAFTPDGIKAYVANFGTSGSNDKTVSVIDVATDTFVRTLYSTSFKEPMYIAFNPQPQGPTNFSGEVIKNRFLTQTTYTHALTWTPTIDPSVVGYKIWRDGKLIATLVGKNHSSYMDQNCKKGGENLYEIASFDEADVQSESVKTKI